MKYWGFGSVSTASRGWASYRASAAYTLGRDDDLDGNLAHWRICINGLGCIYIDRPRCANIKRSLHGLTGDDDDVRRRTPSELISSDVALPLFDEDPTTSDKHQNNTVDDDRRWQAAHRRHVT